MIDLIAHGGGGKSGSSSARVAQEAPDSLRSQAFAKVLDLVCEGPIKGLVNGYQSIFLDGTPLQNSDGTLNFAGVGVDFRLGTQSQSYIAGFADTESEVAVSVQVKQNVPVVRTISSSTLIDAVRITISIPRLTQQDPSNGDLNGSVVTIAIDLDDGSGFVQKILDDIVGKTTTTYQRNYTVELSGPGPHTIRVRRVTADSTSSALQNDTYWDSYTAIEDGKLRYPNSALIAVMVDASQFQSIPTRAFELYLREIQVPVNYDPLTRTYSGVWDGTYKIAWTDNPAWCWLDMVTSTRFGLGRFVDPTIVDKWALYQISKYCDQLVPDGKGGMEPRFTCNLYLQTREEAYKVINNMASVFRGITYWGSGLLTPVQDAPADPTTLYTPSNVIGGEFAYTGTDLTTRHTVAVVQWNDPTDSYKQKFEYVEGDPDDIQRYGVIQTEVVAMGCTSQGQANRVGRWTLYSEANETEALAFTVPLEGALARPGQIIQVQDPSRARVRLGGRVMAATSTMITLDASINIDSTKTYTIACMLPNPPTQDPEKPQLPGFGQIETRTITNGSGLTSAITVSQPFSQVPQQFAVWVISISDLVPQTFRVLGVVEDDNNNLQYNITAVSHNPSKFAHIDLGTPLQNAPISLKPLTVPAPIDVVITQHEHTDSLGVELILSISWTVPGPALTYDVQYKKNSGNWISLGETGSSTIDIDDSGSLPGDYQARVVSISTDRKTSVATLSPIYTLVGKPDIPPGLSDLRTEEGLFEIDLFWDFNPGQPDLLSTEIWASLTNDRSTASLLSPIPYPRISAIETDLPNDTYHYYWGRCQNTSLVYSPWFPVDPLGGVRGHTLGTADKILSLLSGQIAGSNAGRTIAARLDEIDGPTGFSQQLVSIQNANQSNYAQINTIAARLNSPNGDIAKAINRIYSGSTVSKPTPFQILAPLNPNLGDAWYDSNTGGALKFWNGTDWIFASTAITQPAAPAEIVGSLWRDSSTPQEYYKIWDGVQWVYAERATIYSPTQPNTYGAATGDTWKNTTDNTFWVFDGTIWVNTQNTDIAALASQITTLQTTVANATALIQQNQTSVGGVSALYSIKIDNNGYVSGFGLTSDLLPGGNGAYSQFVVSATSFAVGDLNTSPVYPFIVTGGITYIRSALIGAAAVDTLKIAGNAVTIPASSYAPASIPMTAAPQQVASLVVDFGGFAPSAVQVNFLASVSNGGGGNGATVVYIYRDGIPIYSGQDGIVNNVGPNRAIAALQDTPGPGQHTYTVTANIAGPVSSAAILARSLFVTGSLR